MDKFVIKRDSWHWKLYSNFFNKKRPPNFCLYFWGVFFTLAAILFSITVVILFSITVVIFLTSSAVFTTLFLFGVEFSDLFAPFIGSGLTMFFVVFVVSSYLGLKHLVYKLKDTDQMPKQNGLILTKYKSFKEKVCPLIELED